jgi:hypothetical protein
MIPELEIPRHMEERMSDVPCGSGPTEIRDRMLDFLCLHLAAKKDVRDQQPDEPSDHYFVECCSSQPL